MNYRLKSLLYAILGRKTAENIRLSKFIRDNKNKDLCEKIKENIKFKNTHVGERCFILGNGPSLKDVDFNSLSDEFVFTVNNFSMVENYKVVKTNVHIWADLSFFEMREDQKYDHDELMDNYTKISEEKPICFLLDLAYDFVKKNHLDDILDINYFRSFGASDPKIRCFYDLSKSLSCYTTVVQYAISIAMYMGFSEIYLLGCDSTNIISLINSAMDISCEGMHAYKNDDVNKRYKELLNHWTMSDAFYDQYLLFDGYRSLKNECDIRGIRLINCSSKTLINEIPRVSLNDII